LFHLGEKWRPEMYTYVSRTIRIKEESQESCWHSQAPSNSSRSRIGLRPLPPSTISIHSSRSGISLAAILDALVTGHDRGSTSRWEIGTNTCQRSTVNLTGHNRAIEIPSSDTRPTATRAIFRMKQYFR
jgi:hypothetical protein